MPRSVSTRMHICLMLFRVRAHLSYAPLCLDPDAYLSHAFPGPGASQLCPALSRPGRISVSCFSGSGRISVMPRSVSTRMHICLMLFRVRAHLSYAPLSHDPDAYLSHAFPGPGASQLCPALSRPGCISVSCFSGSGRISVMPRSVSTRMHICLMLFRVRAHLSYAPLCLDPDAYLSHAFPGPGASQLCPALSRPRCISVSCFSGPGRISVMPRSVSTRTHICLMLFRVRAHLSYAPLCLDPDAYLSHAFLGPSVPGASQLCPALSHSF